MNRTEYAATVAAAFSGEYAFQIYNRIALEAADATIIGFVQNNTLYAVTTEITPAMLSCERTSAKRGHMESVRIRLNARVKAALKSRARVCGKWDEIKAEMNKGESKPLNDGHVFEKFLTMEAGQTWKRDQVPFWQDGDLTTGGRKYQIKMENAEFSTFTNIRNAIAARA